MCGIFGYVGNRTDAANIVLEGLKLLEYRGYDSWGVSVKVGKKLNVDKHVGKIGQAIVNLPKSNLGIGHTRWATHGGVTVANAHPHIDCSRSIAVVHNGIVENFQDLKKELLKSGHKFVSQTDTEVIAHLIEENFKKGMGFATSVRHAFNLLHGLNAIVIANAVSKEIIAAKTGSPLIAGVGDNEFFVASDASGIVAYTRKVFFLEDNQMLILGKTLKVIQLPEGKEIKPVFHNINWKFEIGEKGKFKHFFLKEVFDQPQIIENIALNYKEQTKKFAHLIDDAFGTFMLACGSASYAALAATYLFSKVAKKHVNFGIGSEFIYLEDYVTKGTLVIPISQSGESIDVTEPVIRAKEKGATIAAIVNVLGSTLYRLSDHKVLIGAGVERSVAATKSFIAMVAVILLTAYTLAKKQDEGEKLLMHAASDVKKILKEKSLQKIKKLADELKSKQHIFIIGRGLSYATALETTLKMKETSYIHAEGFAGGELKHGVIALIEKGTPCIAFAPNDETYDDIISNAQEIKARGGLIIGIGPKDNPVFDRFLQTVDAGDATIIPQVVVAQLLAYNLALKKGIKDPDKPRNLAKSVTVK